MCVRKCAGDSVVETMSGDMLVDSQVDKEEDDQPASPPNKKQRPDEVSVATRANSQLSPSAKSGSSLFFHAASGRKKYTHTYTYTYYIRLIDSSGVHALLLSCLHDM